MKSYEEKLLSAFEEAYTRRVLWSPKPKHAPKHLVWLNKRFGWEIPALYHMSFWQNAVFFGSCFIPVKLLFDYFLFQERSFMLTQGYWFGFALTLAMTSTSFAGAYRFIAWRKGLSRWEDL